jgi:ABC-type transport system involved in Fe-S cluster assembly, permease component
MIDAVGKIIKGAYRSESHQTSRALSFAEGQNATILPELLIDEDDVQASHGMSMGRVDEDALYYLMSRGLSVQQCTSLISQGYLMPITETLQNDDLKKKLKEEMERKMDELC